MIIRDATPQDLPYIVDIYNDAVLNSTAIWMDNCVDLANRQAWFDARKQAGYPILVACDADGAVLGYASFGDWRPFDGFCYSVEHSVYLQPNQRGKGLGKHLLSALIGRAKGCNKHMMVAAIESGNQASIALHQRLGFVITGQMPQVGCKFGRWLDLTFMQLNLSPERSQP